MSNGEAFNEFGDPVFTYDFPDSTREVGRRELLKTLQRETVIGDELEKSKDHIIHKKFISASGLRYDSTLTDHELAISTGSGFTFHAGIGKDKILHLDVELTRMIRGELTRDPLFPHFTDLVRIALHYFQTGGMEALGILGAWNPKHFQDNRNVNYDVFVDRINKGFSEEEAALVTPTGRVVSSLGYKYPVVLSPSNNRKPLTGYDVVFLKNKPR
ncbi:hypothetical protein A2363_01235 [Candidatus Gottesmanbacteria bacterium RIFOXYB1_FULL_47_11]|uniref:Uncharacterized protein n=1 Tax=Candidatus Gottesmanbacteria bacterium RIFOXYB1_FULL_47_11 TaxID=1798401 RepID=A0A1F6BDS3_9BACT|nr:MAG: hypothetical protein A2363_01235 [Candidatus Gottesmanbacteria bacterium RIFOXYB1_FULL_47_11]